MVLKITKGRKLTRRVPAASTLAMAFLLMGAVTPVALDAHPEAVLESDTSTTAAGGTIVLRGSQFGDGGTFTLRLLGPLNEYDVGEATSDADGLFQLSLAVPMDVRPGAYQVVAIAPDGDVAARLDLAITAAMPIAADTEERAAGGEMQDHEATADEIRIERDRDGIEWAAIGLVIGAAGGLGIGLRRRQTA